MRPSLALDDTLNPFDALGIVYTPDDLHVMFEALRTHLSICSPRDVAHWKSVLDLFERDRDAVALWAFLARSGGLGEHPIDTTLCAALRPEEPKDLTLVWEANEAEASKDTPSVVLHDLLYLPPLETPNMVQEGLGAPEVFRGGEGGDV